MDRSQTPDILASYLFLSQNPLLNRLVEHIFNHVVEQNTASDDRLDLVFHTLADGTRRKIIELLRESGELKVGDLAKTFDMSLNGVSKHLKVLERAELIQREVRGREHWIRVQWSTLQEPYEWLHFYHHFWSKRLNSLVDYVSKQGDKK
jgi:DNA-binding transcriptional ArsR family regulator